MIVTNLEFHFNITEQVCGKEATIAPNAFIATMSHILEEFLAKEQSYKNVNDWLAAWIVWLHTERNNESVQS
jgi:hypothetical protein